MSGTIEIMQNALSSLNGSNYAIYLNALPQEDLCFEIIAEHRAQQTPILVLKIVQNIDNIKPHFIQELKLLSKLLAAMPLLIGQENRREKLQDNVVYMRDNLVAINIRTLHHLLTEAFMLPLAIAKQGGFFIDINGNKLQQLRESRGLSRQELASQLSLTAKAISHYEKNEMRTSVEHAKFFEDVFQESLVVSSNFFKMHDLNTQNVELNDDLGRRITAKNRDFMGEIKEYINNAGFKVFFPRNAPFDLFIYQENDSTHEIEKGMVVGGTYPNKPLTQWERLQIKVQFLKRVDYPGVMIVDEENPDSKPQDVAPIPCILPKDLKLLEHPEEFQKSLFKKKFH